MADSDENRLEEREFSEGAWSEPMATKVNWVPAVAALGVFVWWVLLAFFLYGFLPDLRDAARFVAYVLFGVAVAVAVPVLLRQVASESSPAVRRTGVMLICLAVAIPLSFGLYWSAYDALAQVRVRPEGELPNIGSLIGRNRHDVGRVLGTHEQVGEVALAPSYVSGISRPGGALAQLLVVYSLPDLSTLGDRPEKRAAQETESQQLAQLFGSGLSPREWGSDAVVVVYYGSDSKAVGARMDVSMRKAASVMSEVTSQSVFAATGVDPQAAVVRSDSQAAESSTTSGPPSEVYWGIGTAEKTSIGYRLQIGGLAGEITGGAQQSASLLADPGDLTLVVAPGLTDPGAELVASVSSTSTSGSGQLRNTLAPGPSGPKPHGESSHSDETFWIITLSRPLATEEDAVRRADELSAQSGNNGRHFSVERSGHLEGLALSDAWFAMYDVGYLYEDDAKKVVASNPPGFPLTDVRVVHVTKRCGDLTISEVIR